MPPSGDKRSPFRSALSRRDFRLLLGGLAVSAVSDGVLYRIRGEDFLEAVSLAPAIPGILRLGVVGRLARTHPSRRAGVGGGEEG